MTKIEDAFEHLQIHHKDAQITNGHWHPLPFLTTFSVIASKASHHHNQTRLLFYIHWGDPKGGEPLYASIVECPMFQKRK
jgi:hypothetical protein